MRLSLKFFAPIFLFTVSSALAGAPVIHTEIRGTINPATADYLGNAISRAEATQASALIVSLDTPGGLVSSVEKMAQSIDRSKVPVVVYVEPAGAAATSAGALLLLASHVGAMTPGSHMGSAHPVDSSGSDVKGAMGEKVLNATSSFAEGIASVRGRDPKLAAEIVRKSRSFTAGEAANLKLIDVLADSVPDLLRKLDGREVKLAENHKITLRGTSDAQLVDYEMSFGQKLLHLLSDPNIAAILMTLGMVLIYMELQAPGIQIAGILGIICLVVAFMAFQTLPIRTGGIALILIGVVALIAEIFVTSHGVLGVGGVLSFILGMIWVIDPTQIQHGVSPAVYIPAAIFLGGSALSIAWFASRTKAKAAAALAEIKGGGPGGLAGYVGRVESLAGNGTPGSGAMASPFGKIWIRGELWDFTSEDSVRIGDEVEVVKTDGLRAIVRPVRPQGSAGR